MKPAELARRVGVTPAAVSRWECGAAEPTHANLEHIACACGIGLDEFWGELPGGEVSA